MPFYKVCLLSDLSDQHLKMFEIEGLEVLFVLSALSPNGVYAFDNNCNHADKPLEKGRWNKATAEITCPFHKAIFSIKEAGIVKAPPACVPLPIYQTEIREIEMQKYVYVFLE